MYSSQECYRLTTHLLGPRSLISHTIYNRKQEFRSEYILRGAVVVLIATMVRETQLVRWVEAYRGATDARVNLAPPA